MVVFHHRDMDGYASAAVVGLYRALHLDDAPEDRPVEADQNIIFYGLQYGDDIPVNLPGKNDRVYIVDFHFPRADMDLLLKRVPAGQIVWIDHHVSHLTQDYGVELPGSRVDGKAGCRLTWEHLFGDRPLPEALALIEDYDIWAHKLPDSRAFMLGMETIPNAPHCDIWRDLLDHTRHAPDVRHNIVLNIIERGKVAQDFRRVVAEDACQSYGFETVIDGHPVFVLSGTLRGSDTFGSRVGVFGMVATQTFAGDRWVVSLYSSPDSNIDVSEICKRFQGGGHRGAAGWVSRGTTPPLVKGKELKSVALETVNKQ